MDAVVEVRQVVLARPFFNLASIPIRSSVAVGSSAIVLLEPLLIFPFELVVENDAMDLRPLAVQATFLPKIGTIQLGVVRQLTWSADASVEGLLATTITVAAMGFKQALTTVRQCHGAFAARQRHGSRQTLLAYVTEMRITWVRFVAEIREISFRYYAKCPNRRERPAVVSV